MARQSMDWDVVIIGDGSAGIEAGLRAGAFGLKTLLVEKAQLGGDRTSTSGVCSVAFLHAAGKDVGASAFAQARQCAEQARAANISEARLRDAGVEIRYGTPRFIAEDAIDINGERVTARDFILCTGSSPDRPDIPGLEEAGYRTSREVFDLDHIPGSVGIIGAGQTGVQLTQAFSRLGSKVVLFEEGDRILPGDDIELTSWLMKRLRGEGIDIHLDTRVESM